MAPLKTIFGTFFINSLSVYWVVVVCCFLFFFKGGLITKTQTSLPAYLPHFPLLRMVHGGQGRVFACSSCCSSSSSSENHDRPHLYYHITLWASIKKEGLLRLLAAAGMTNALRVVSPGQRARARMR